MTSGSPSGWASFDHSLKNVLRLTVMPEFGSYFVHLYGPVPGGGKSTFFAGVSAGRVNANGTASFGGKSGAAVGPGSFWRNLGSAVVRWNVIVLPLASTPPVRSQDFGFLMHASAPLMTLYQVPELGLLPILNSRSNVAFTSAPVTVFPLENLMLGRSVNVYVLPLSVGDGTVVARSGTSFVPSAPAARLKPTSPSWVMIRNCHSCAV